MHILCSKTLFPKIVLCRRMWGGQGPPRGVEPLMMTMMMMMMWKDVVEPDRPQMTVLCAG